MAPPALFSLGSAWKAALSSSPMGERPENTFQRGVLRRAASFGNWFVSSNALHKSSVRDSCGLAAAIVTVPQLVALSLGW